MNRISFKVIYLLTLFIGLIGTGKASAQEFPNALALLQYLKGVNASKVPEIVEADFSINYFTENQGPQSGNQIFINGESHVVLYDDKVGVNAKVHIRDSLVLILKSERVYETKRIDIENFLLFRIHTQKPEQSIATLNQLGIDTDKIDEGIRLGRPMWIIGSYRREANTPQVWIDKELLVVKKIHYINLAQQSLEQMEWGNFKKLGDFYFPLDCELRSDPEMLFSLKRQNVKTLNEIPKNIQTVFDF